MLWLISYFKIKVPTAIINCYLRFVRVIIITDVTLSVKQFAKRQSLWSLHFDNKTTSLSWRRRCIKWSRWLQTRMCLGNVREAWIFLWIVHWNPNLDGIYLPCSFADVFVTTPVRSLTFLSTIPCSLTTFARQQFRIISKAKGTVCFQGCCVQVYLGMSFWWHWLLDLYNAETALGRETSKASLSPLRTASPFVASCISK